MASFLTDQGERWQKAVSTGDNDPRLESFVLKLCDHFGIEADPLGPRTYLFKDGPRFNDDLPRFRAGGMAATFDRETAVRRDELVFLNWDHPLVAEMTEALLAGQTGNCGIYRHAAAKGPEVVLTATFVLECLCPARFYADRFLPPTALHLAVNHRLEAALPPDPAAGGLSPLPPGDLQRRLAVAEPVWPQMLRAVEELAEKRKADVVTASLERMREDLGAELARLEALMDVNPHIPPAEPAAVRDEIDQLAHHLPHARLRLDTLGLVFVEPE